VARAAGAPPEGPVQAVTAAFRSATGTAPQGVWSAPGRVNLIGEHTDYNEGLCLPIALPQRTFAAARRRPGRVLAIRSLQAPGPIEVDLDEIAPGRPGGWAAYVAGVAWALERAGHRLGGLEVVVDGHMPPGAGLSSSAALECSVALAVNDLYQLGLGDDDAGRASLAAACVAAENTIAGAPTGGMDQAAALRSRAAHALLLDCRDGSVRHLPFDLTEHRLSLLVMDTRAEHALVDGQYAARRADCEHACAVLGIRSLREVGPPELPRALAALGEDRLRRRVRHIVTETERVRLVAEALRREDFEAVGRVLRESHASMRDDFEISCVELDLAVDTAMDSGALGSRMTGGGFGGSAVALVPAGRAAAVAAEVRAAFAGKGFRAPHCFPVTAGGPAHRDA
jgi:galactokinase